MIIEVIRWSIQQWWFYLLFGMFTLYFAYKAACPKQKGYSLEQIREAEQTLKKTQANPSVSSQEDISSQEDKGQ